MKSCNKCGELKVDSEFYVDRNNDGSSRSICAECDKSRFSKYYRNNILSYKKRSKDKYLEDKEKAILAAKEWKEKNKDRYNQLSEKYKKDPTFVGQKKVAGLKIKFKELKCSIKNFVLYIESQLDLGMTWDNYKTVWKIVYPENISHYTDYTVEKI